MKDSFRIIMVLVACWQFLCQLDFTSQSHEDQLYPFIKSIPGIIFLQGR
jgi:hypothetical protein